jgi:hypothetical protein
VTPIAWMWTLSTAGALLFFAAGMLARRMPRAAGGVIADDLGLLVAGDHQSGVALAAVGGYLHGVGNRMREFLGFNPAARILVEDDAGNSVTATPMPGASAQLVAVVVTGSWRRSD